MFSFLHCTGPWDPLSSIEVYSCLDSGPETGRLWHVSIKAGPLPLEAILVVFGRRALIFFLFESSWKKNEKWHHFCAHAQCWSPWRRKNVEKGHLAPSNLTFLLFAIDTNGFRRMKEEGQIYKRASDFLIFAKGGSYDLSKFSDDFTPFFRLWKTITTSLGKN